MFGKDDGCAFKYKGKKECIDGKATFYKHTYSFKTQRNNTYLVEVDEFEYFELCAVKFYLKAHRHSNRKYQLITKLNEMPSILSTCVNIMLERYQSNPLQSFGFIGMNNENEEEANSKRFRLYSKVMQRVLTPDKFTHEIYIDKSIYLLLNKESLVQVPDLRQKIETFFVPYL